MVKEMEQTVRYEFIETAKKHFREHCPIKEKMILHSIGKTNIERAGIFLYKVVR